MVNKKYSNPADKVLSTLMLIGWGHSGIVYEISKQLVVKRRVMHDDEGAFVNENRIFDLLEDSSHYCPSLIRSALRDSAFNFLENAGENLETRLQRHQILNPKTRQVIEVRYKEPRDVVIQWMLHLTEAITTLESLGSVHGDIPLATSSSQMTTC